MTCFSVINQTIDLKRESNLKVRAVTHMGDAVLGHGSGRIQHVRLGGRVEHAR